jgi:hypothetical protein
MAGTSPAITQNKWFDETGNALQRGAGFNPRQQLARKPRKKGGSWLEFTREE